MNCPSPRARPYLVGTPTASGLNDDSCPAMDCASPRGTPYASAYLSHRGSVASGERYLAKPPPPPPPWSLTPPNPPGGGGSGGSPFSWRRLFSSSQSFRAVSTSVVAPRRAP